MKLNIARRMQIVRGSVIRQMAEAASRLGVISFANGNPSPDSFPVEAITEIMDRIMRERPSSMLLYGLSQGYPPLIETMKDRLARTQGIDFTANEMIIVSGGQQACDLAAKVLLNEGDVVVTEEPSFASCYNTFRAYGAELVGVPMEEDGMNLERLEQALEENRDRVRVLYIITSFQNPTGVTTSKEKRERIYQLACRYGIAIFEDDPYSELRFSGEPIPPLKAIDTEGIVVYAGSFSKVMAPAFRLGYVVFDKSILQQMTVAKQTTDVHSTLLFQHITSTFINEYNFDDHIGHCRTLYRTKSDLMLAGLGRHMPPTVRYVRPQGGLFVMAFLPEGIDAFPFVWKALERGVACVPGSGFMIDQDMPNNGFRLCYSTPCDEEIVRGTKILGDCAQEWLEQDIANCPQ